MSLNLYCWPRLAQMSLLFELFLEKRLFNLRILFFWGFFCYNVRDENTLVLPGNICAHWNFLCTPAKGGIWCHWLSGLKHTMCCPYINPLHANETCIQIPDYMLSSSALAGHLRIFCLIQQSIFFFIKDPFLLRPRQKCMTNRTTWTKEALFIITCCTKYCATVLQSVDASGASSCQTSIWIALLVKADCDSDSD